MREAPQGEEFRRDWLLGTKWNLEDHPDTTRKKILFYFFIFIFLQCSPWPEVTYVNNSPSPGFNNTHNSFPVAEG